MLVFRHGRQRRGPVRLPACSCTLLWLTRKALSLLALILVVGVGVWDEQQQYSVEAWLPTNSVPRRTRRLFGSSSFHRRSASTAAAAITRLHLVNQSHVETATTETTSSSSAQQQQQDVMMDDSTRSSSSSKSVPASPHWAHPRQPPPPLDEETNRDGSSSSSSTPPSLGDIMSDLLVTDPSAVDHGPTAATSGRGDFSHPTSLTERYGICHPLDRMALTANGNLQRLVGSYYDASVSVVVDSCQLRKTKPEGNSETKQKDAKGLKAPASRLLSSPPNQPSKSGLDDTGTNNAMVWDRVVYLRVYNQTFCTATSVIRVYDPLCQQLVATGQVGLGQLFRYLDLLPNFYLHQAGPTTTTTTVDTTTTTAAGGGGGFWRDYTLSCPELSCRIHEEFVTGMWEMQPLTLPDENSS